MSIPILRPLSPPLKAFRFAFSVEQLEPLQALYHEHVAPVFEQANYARKLEGVYYQHETLPGEAFDLISYDTYPLLWITNRTAKSYHVFERFFQQIRLEAGLKQQGITPSQVRVYSGFFVLGNRAPEPLWHYDYRTGAQAFTLITPLFPWHPSHGHLLYQDTEQREHRYRYQQGEAICFGDGFLHSTEPYAPGPELRVLVSLTFGSKRWRDWDLIQRNIREQSHFYRLPCGHASTQHCKCYARWQRWQKLLGKK